jgi:hypothetical protein
MDQGPGGGNQVLTYDHMLPNIAPEHMVTPQLDAKITPGCSGCESNRYGLEFSLNVISLCWRFHICFGRLGCSAMR